MSDTDKAAFAATLAWLRVKAEHSKAQQQLNKLGREMGTAFTAMLETWAKASPELAVLLEDLRKAARDPR